MILITTKRGKIGKPTVTLDMNVGACSNPLLFLKWPMQPIIPAMLNEISYYNDPSGGMNQVYSEDDIRMYGERC